MNKKDFWHSLVLAGKKVMTTATSNCLKKCVGKYDVTEDETKLIPLPAQYMKAACDAFSSNLGEDDFTA
jgi:hypothetical protein